VIKEKRIYTDNDRWFRDLPITNVFLKKTTNIPNFVRTTKDSDDYDIVIKRLWGSWYSWDYSGYKNDPHYSLDHSFDRARGRFGPVLDHEKSHYPIRDANETTESLEQTVCDIDTFVENYCYNPEFFMGSVSLREETSGIDYLFARCFDPSMSVGND